VLGHIIGEHPPRFKRAPYGGAALSGGTPLLRNEDMKFTYKRREFLNPVESHFNSFIAAIVESSDEGTYLMGNYIVTLADCKRAVQFEFPLANGYLRRISVRKAELLADTFANFRDALKVEADLITKNYKKGQGSGRPRRRDKK
jgi:hypothetical protein